MPYSLKRTTRDGYHSRGEGADRRRVPNLAYGVLLGYAIRVIRAKGAPTTPKYLMAAHVGTLLQAAVLAQTLQTWCTEYAVASSQEP
jgi:hypothetical protein